MTTSNRTGVSRVLPIVAGTVAAVVTLAGCSALTPSSPTIERGKAIEAACPTDGPLASYVAIDASGSRVRDGVGGDIELALRDAASRSAVCSGHLRVSAFAGSSAGTATLYDGSLHLSGATDNARYQRIDKTVESVVDEVDDRYKDRPALAGGSDIVGQLRLAQEFSRQAAPEGTLAVVVLTDGFQTWSPRTQRVLDADGARRAAGDYDVPDLSGADLTFAGIGNAEGHGADTGQVELLVAFYGAICEATGAARCTVVTEYASSLGGE